MLAAKRLTAVLIAALAEDAQLLDAMCLISCFTWHLFLKMQQLLAVKPMISRFDWRILLKMPQLICQATYQLILYVW